MDIPNKELRLKKFYGDVAKAQNSDIIALITGKRVLDIGCGYGNLMDQIIRERKGIEVIGIDIDLESVKIAKDLYDIDVKPVSVYKMDFPDDYFDTVILREVIHHFDTANSREQALGEIRRVCGRELIVFDPNPNWIVRFSRRVIGHKDPEAPLREVVGALTAKGFRVTKCTWRDVIALPLSGGFVGKELVPNIDFLKRALISCDRWLNAVLSTLNIQSHICWRYLIYATKVKIR